MTLEIFDLLLLLGLTLRLTRIVTVDQIGEWWIRDPANHWAVRRSTPKRRQKAIRLVGGLECPFCVGFWIAVGTTLSLWAVGGPGDADVWWRYTATIFALNWLAAHIGARMGDS